MVTWIVATDRCQFDPPRVRFPDNAVIYLFLYSSITEGIISGSQSWNVPMTNAPDTTLNSTLAPVAFFHFLAFASIPPCCPRSALLQPSSSEHWQSLWNHSRVQRPLHITNLPSELLSEITRNVVSKEDLSRLRSVNSLFETLATPEIFKSITVRNNKQSADRFWTLLRTSRITLHIQSISFVEGMSR